MATYSWRVGGPKPKVSADIFGRTLERLAGDRPLHAVTPQEIVEEARRRSSPIHAAWSWNKDKAAEEFFISRARHLVQALQIVRVRVEGAPPLSSKAVFSVRLNNRRGYVMEDRIRSDGDLTRQVIESARKELQIYILKFQNVAGFGRFIPRLQEVVAEMQDAVDAVTVEATTRSRRGGARAADAEERAT